MYDQTIAAAVCSRIVAVNLDMFDSFPDVDADDLAQECQQAVLRASERFDPSKGASWSTWCGRCAHSRLIDIYRVLKNRRVRENRQAKTSTQADSGENLSDEFIAIIDRSIDAAETRFSTYAKCGPHRFTKPQLCAILMLKTILNSSYRGTVMMLAARPDAMERMGLRTLPHDSTLRYAARTLRRMTHQRRLALGAVRKKLHERKHATTAA